MVIRRLAVLILLYVLVMMSVNAYATDVIIEEPTPDTMPPTLSSISVSETEITVGSMVTMTIEAQDDLSGISTIYANYYGPNNISKTVNFSFNQSSQKFEGNLSFNQYEGGTWILKNVSLRDNKDNTRYVYNSASPNSADLFDFSPYTIEVSGGITDKTPPTLQDIHIIANSQVKPGDHVKITADAFDEGAGIAEFSAAIKTPTGGGVLVSLYLNQSTGLYEGSFMVDRYDELGKWKLDYVTLNDLAKNRIYIYDLSYSNSNATKMDFSNCVFEVTETTPDLIAPLLESLSISLEQVNSNGAVVKLTLQSSDNLSGISYIYGYYSKPSGASKEVYFSRNYETGFYEGRVQIDKFDQLGTWKLTRISLSDGKRNYRTISDSSYDYGYRETADFSPFHFTVRGVITIPPASPFSVGIQPKEATLSSGDKLNLKTTLNMTDSTVKDVTTGTTGTVYTSTDPSRVTVDANGVITVLANAKPGVVFIQAENSGKSSQVQVTIPGEELSDYLRIDPIAIRLAPGQTKTLTVTAAFADGTVRDVTLGETGIKYSVSDSSGAVTVSQNGLVSVAANAVKGTVKIVANYNDLVSETSVTVISPPTVSRLSIAPAEATIAVGGTLQLNLRATLSDGADKDVTGGASGTSYTSSDSERALVDENGLVTIPANAPLGKVYITALNHGVTAKSAIMVDGPRLTNMTVTPASQIVHRGDKLNFNVSGTFSDGVTKSLTDAADGTIYLSANTRRAIVDENGKVTVPDDALYGDVVVTVKNGGVSVTSTLTVLEDLSNKIVSISAVPVSKIVHRGDLLALAVSGTYGSGVIKNITSSSEGTTYISSNTRRASVDENGIVTIPDDALYGDVVITVKNGANQATVILTVEEIIAIKLTGLNATPATKTMHRGESVTLTVTGTYGDGSTKDLALGSTGTTYVSANTRRASVDTNGLVLIPTDALYGDVSITIKNGTSAATITLTIEEDVSGKLIGITAAPATKTMHRGESVTLTVTGTYGDGSTKDLTLGSSGTTYVSANTRRASVDTNGLVLIPTDALYGDVSITIKNGTSAATITLTIEEDVSGKLIGITAAPATKTMHRGESVTLTVTGTYGDGSTKDLALGSSGTTYVSANTRRASVDTNGLVLIPTDALYGDVSITIKNGTSAATITLTIEEDVSGKLIGITAAPATKAMHRGESVTLTVTGTYGDGSTKDLRLGSSGTTYVSANTRRAVIDTDGMSSIPSNALYGDVVITIRNGTVSTTVTLTIAP